jgi:hypothetical protein
MTRRDKVVASGETTEASDAMIVNEIQRKIEVSGMREFKNGFELRIAEAICNDRFRPPGFSDAKFVRTEDRPDFLRHTPTSYPIRPAQADAAAVEVQAPFPAQHEAARAGFGEYERAW